MKKTNIILITFILFFALIITHSYAIDLDLINSIRANEIDSASNITTNTISNTTNSSSSTGIDLTLDSEDDEDDDYNYDYDEDNETSDDEYYTNNTENISTNNVSNNVSSILADTPEADLGLANILNILLIVVGVLLILLGIAILIRTKR